MLGWVGPQLRCTVSQTILVKKCNLSRGARPFSSIIPSDISVNTSLYVVWHGQ